MALFAPASLLDLSDDVLLLIFSYLKAWDLVNVAQTCERFNKVARDKSLWTDADFSAGCLSLQQLRRWQAFLRPTTRRLVLRGFKKRFAGTPRWKTPLVSASILKLLGDRCQELDELTLCEAYVDAKKLKIVDFLPIKSLKKLSLVDCEFANLPSPLEEGSYFRRTHKILTNLQHLKITKCSWIDDYDIMVLSKIDTLKSLVLRNLPKVGRAMAYIALGFRFGFQNLELLDLRGTSLQDNEVMSVVQNGKLKSLYLGPMGPVKRLPQESSREHNLVMPDPRWQEERHQVVVINVGPNGPHWRQVNDEELDGMGLQWVRSAQRRRAEEEDEDRHYFIGRDGRPIERNENNEGRRVEEDEEDEEEEDDNNDEDDEHEGEPPSKRQMPVISISKASTAKGDRKVVDASKPNNGDALEESGNGSGVEGQSGKQRKELEEHGEEEDEEAEDLEGCYHSVDYDTEDDNLQHEPYQRPDEGLSDNLVRAFGQNTKSLHTLVLAGCAISDEGLQNIIRLVPSLQYLDVTNTKVTSAGVQEARVARPECIILGGGTRVVRQNDR